MEKLCVDLTGYYKYLGKTLLIKLFNTQTHIGKYLQKINKKR